MHCKRQDKHAGRHNGTLRIMSSKANAACKTVATKTNKNTVENCKQHSPSIETSPGGVVAYDNCNTLIEVTVKTKGRKRTSTMVSSSPTNHKAIEEKRRPGSSGDSHQNWAHIFNEQKRAVVKQGLQEMVGRSPASKSVKHRSESKDIKKHTLGQKHEYKHLDEIPVKQPASQKKTEKSIKSTPRTANPSSTSIASSMESILVIDKSVQCDGMFDSVRTLGFLIKELEHLVKDERANKILNEMEQVLFRMPTESEKSPVVDLEAMVLRTKLEASTLQLEETSRKMNTMCETLREERDSLQRQVQKQVLMLNEGREKRIDLETLVKTLKLELEEAMKTIQAKEKTISELKEKIKGYEFSQNVIADLRTNLAEQAELARQRHLEVQYLTLEKDKLSVLSSYKDSLLMELRNAIKELQNHIADQLTGLKDMYVHEESSNPQMSLVHGGLACSSPTSTFSRESNTPISWNDISDVSLSTVDHNPPRNSNMQRFLPKPSFSDNHLGNSEKKRTKNVQESQTKDSVNLEFVSLPCGESSHTLLPSYKDLGCTEMSQSVNKGKDDMVTFSNTKNDNLRNSKSAGKISSWETVKSSPEKIDEKEARLRDSPTDRKSSEQRKQSSGKKSTDDTSNILKSNSSHNLIGPTITEQFQNMFHDIRAQSKMPVNVPSPPRNYPHPDWSDSTLPSISTASDLNYRIII